MTVWKIVQRHTYDLLSHKYSVIVILICLSAIVVSVFLFGEVSSGRRVFSSCFEASLKSLI
jgi:hypothetical protein